MQSTLCQRSVSRTGFLGERDVRTPLVVPAIWAFGDDGGGEDSVYKGGEKDPRKRYKLTPSAHGFSAGWFG